MYIGKFYGLSCCVNNSNSQFRPTLLSLRSKAAAVSMICLSPKKLLLEVCREECGRNWTRLVRPGHFGRPRIKQRVAASAVRHARYGMGIGRVIINLQSACPFPRTCSSSRDRTWGMVALSGRSAVLRRHTVVINRGVSIWITCMCGRRYLRQPGSRRAKLPCSYVLKGREGIKLPHVRVGVFFILRASHASYWGYVTEG